MLWWVLITFAAWVLAAQIDSSRWLNLHYYRNVDLSRGYVKELDLIEAKNTGDSPNDLYFFTLNDGFGAIPPISFIGVTVVESKTQLQPFKVGGNVYAIKFVYPIAPGSSVEFKVRYVYTNTIKPYPEKIAMDSRQKLLIQLNKYAYSPYPILDYLLAFTGFAKGQEMDLQLATAATPGLPKLTGRVESEALIYGPVVEEIAPYAIVPMGLAYEHNRPITRAITLERSFWFPASDAHVVQTEEYYELTNNGAQLESGFSRTDWMKGRYEMVRDHYALSQLEFPEDTAAPFNDYYVVDKVGKVSTHHRTQGHMVMQPRFPLFGGWHYNFTLGWNTPLDAFVKKSSKDMYVARFPLLNGLRDIYYDDVYLHFYLPEGAEFVSFSGPVLHDDLEVGSAYSYLDVSDGHVKVTVHFANLYDELAPLEVYIKYWYPAQKYWDKVAKIAGCVFVALASYYALGLLDLSVKSKEAEEKDVEEVQAEK